MKITFISDTHGQMGYLKKEYLHKGGDVLIHSGDLTNSGSLGEVFNQLTIMRSLPFKYKFFMPGNHDLIFESNPKESIELVDQINKTFCNEPGGSIELIFPQGLKTIDYGTEKINLFFSCYMPKFGNWAFMLPRNSAELRKEVEKIPNNIDILVTHSPPLGILDKNREGNPCGCEILKEMYQSKKISPKLHAFGHIHETPGIQKTWGTTFINASSLCHVSKGSNFLLQVREPYTIEYGV